MKFLLFLVLFVSSAVAQENTIYYILDSSGSMWGRVDGQMKTIVAKDVLSDLIKNTPENISIALSTYGHRKLGDCSDIEELISIEEGRDRALDKFQKIKPKGKTPMADSVRMAFDKVGKLDGPSTIVLVSDGIETCNPNPCNVVREIFESSTKVKLHVVGFGVNEETKSQLKCFAEKGRGNYFSANNATSLLDSLNAIKKSVVEKVELPTEPTPVEEVKKETTSNRIKIIGPGRVKIMQNQYTKKPYEWFLYDPETGEKKGSFTSIGADQIVPAGIYQLGWHQREHGSSIVKLTEVIEVKSKELSEVNLDTVLSLARADWVSDKIYYWGLKDVDSGEWIAKFSNDQSPEIVPAGTYRLVYRHIEHGSSESDLGLVTIEPSKNNVFELNTGIKIIPSEDMVKNPYRIDFIDLNETEKKRYVRRSGSYDPIVLAPGRYRIDFWDKEHGGSNVTIVESLELDKGQLLEIEL